MQNYHDKRRIIAQHGAEKWNEVQRDRHHRANPMGLLDKRGEPFWFVLTPALLDRISEIERGRGFLASLRLPKKFLDQYAVDTQKREAYYSSHIEGAVTSLEAALLHLNKPSRKDYGDESLQMIVNNRDALQYIRQQGAEPVSHGMICELHKILVRNTHKQRPITVGAYRRGAVYVIDGGGQVIYEGPPSSEVPRLMEAYVQWINGDSDIHPLIKAAVVHLYFVHVHPFDDGNGRSARALSNLYLMKEGYQFINFLSPSDYFDHHRGDYYRAIQNAEAHERDATFFILYYLKALTEQLRTVQIEIQKEKQVRDIRDLLAEKVRIRLDRKQIKALQWMLDHSEAMTTRKYCKLGHCSDETARKDFNRLLEAGLIERTGSGRATQYLLKIRQA